MTAEPFCKNCGGLKSAHIREQRTWGEAFRCTPHGDSWFSPWANPPSPSPENAGITVHGSLVPEQSSAARLAIAAANCIATLLTATRLDESYQKSADQVEKELRQFAGKQPPSPTLSEVIEYRKELKRCVELRSPPLPSDSETAEKQVQEHEGKTENDQKQTPQTRIQPTTGVER